jgi:hypothetical protein
VPIGGHGAVFVARFPWEYDPRVVKVLLGFML